MKKAKPIKAVEPTPEATLYDLWLAELRVLMLQLQEGGATVPMRDRIFALSCVGRTLIQDASLRKGSKDVERSGSSVRKYSKAFATDAARGGKARARSTPAPAAFEAGYDLDTLDDDGIGNA